LFARREVCLGKVGRKVISGISIFLKVSVKIEYKSGSTERVIQIIFTYTVMQDIANVVTYAVFDIIQAFEDAMRKFTHP